MADSYSFATQPATVKSKRKHNLYRPEIDNEPLQNVMFDRRVVRGNTYSGQVVPGNAVNVQGGRRRSRLQTLTKERSTIYEARPKPRAETVDLTQHLVEHREEISVSEEMTQTAVFLPRPETPPYIPSKRGVDRGTQIEKSDGLFNFESEVDPILDVIVSKTLEQSLLEVTQEDEMEHLRGMRAKLAADKAQDEARIREMERAEVERWEAKERLKRKEAERLRNEFDLCKKVAARNFYRSWLGGLQQDTFVHLADIGHFRDAQRDAVVDSFMPAILAKVADRIDASSVSRRCTEALLMSALETRRRVHQEKLLKEAAAASAAEEEERRRSGNIRIFIRGIDDSGEGIPVSADDTVAEVEEKIMAWVAENASDFAAPEGGFLNAAFAGVSLDPDTKLLDTELSSKEVVEIDLPTMDGEALVDGEAVI